jgi:hypothetical protein
MKTTSILLRGLSVLCFLATSVFADGAAIVAALEKVGSDAAQLNDTVLSWPGDLLGLLPILADSTTLLADINEGTKTAEQSANLTDAESITVYSATLSLSSGVNQTLDTIVNAKPKFEALFVAAPVVLLNLEEEKSATDKFSAAIISKVPTALQSIADGVVAGIDAAFDSAISDYQGAI